MGSAKDRQHFSSGLGPLRDRLRLVAYIPAIRVDALPAGSSRERSVSSDAGVAGELVPPR